jgi:hypothetical protein
LVSVSITKYIPSLDGPQHLHTINVLTELIKGNDFVAQYYQINPLPAGYWSAHFIIGFFHLFLPSWVAEKSFLYIYILGMFFSFRYLVKKLNHNPNSATSLLIFPFMFSSYLLLGYYTFSFAAIFYFLTLGYWFHISEKLLFSRLLIFSLLVAGIFFSHALVFVFFGITFTILLLPQLLNKELTLRKRFYIFLKVAFVILPSLALWINYSIRVIKLDSTVKTDSITILEQWLEFFRIRLLVGFDHLKESIGYRVIFLLLTLLLVISIYYFVRRVFLNGINFKNGINGKTANIFLLTSMVFLVMYFFAPNRISAGSLTNRFGLYFFFNLIIWLSVQSFPRWINYLVIALVIPIFMASRLIHLQYYRADTSIINELKEVEAQIPPNSTVFLTSYATGWHNGHFGLYVGSDVPVINVLNPQCWGQFPVVWKFAEMPKLVMGDQEINPKISSIESTYSTIDTIEYQLVYYQKEFWSSPEDEDRKQLITRCYDSIYRSSEGNISLYRLKSD